MAGLKQFKFIPKDLMEWSLWMRYQEVEEALGNPDETERVLTSSVDGERSWVRRLDNWPAQFRGATNQDLGTSAITVDLATTDYDPGVNYGLSADNVLIESAGYYKINYTVFASVDTLGGAANCNVLAFLRKNTTAIDGSYSAAYLSEVSTPDTSCDGIVLVFCSAGDAIDLQAQLSAAQDVSTVAARCKIIIERVR